MKKSMPPWILALHVFVSFLIVSYSVQVVADNVGNSEGISIDCGVTQATWDKNNFYYEADDGNVVESGQVHNISSEYTPDIEDEQVWQQLETLRSFPEGERNCYSLKPKQGRNNKYLVRAYYIYGNYDGNYDHNNSVPDFDFHLGVNFWTASDTSGPDSLSRIEVIHFSPTNYIDVCLIKTGPGIPFISLLELWPLPNSMYQTSSNLLPLELMTRSSLGTSNRDNAFIRYADDTYGRSWFLHRETENSAPINATFDIDGDDSDYKLPKQVLGTAIRSQNRSSPLVIYLGDYDTDYEYSVYLHFFDFDGERSDDQQRKMQVTFTESIQAYIPLKYMEPRTIFKTIPKGQHLNNISITSTSDSSLPPMINAIEIFRVLPQPYSTTHEGDVDAMRVVKHAYNITRNWQGDPCMPSNYSWEGLTCNLDRIPMVTSLNLSSSKLTGEISTSFSNLTSLESLDLSNNELMGEIPEVLGMLPNLRKLNLSGNNLTGSIPKALREKNGTSLVLSLDGNPSICQIGACKTKESIVPIIASVVASVAILVIAVCISVKFYQHKRKKQSGDMEVMTSSFKKDGNLKAKNRAFDHLEVLSITNNFETVIGQGGFGKVYLGTLQDDTQVAVKLLSKSSQQGFKEFQSEAELLMVVHHRNLVSLFGYCNDGDMKALVYEYMTEGNLRQKLSDKNPCALKWNERLQIALDAACGLDYLHNGCKPAIIHRDVKTSNILLSKNMQAKIADFGLSRAFFDDTNTQFSTSLAGTIGYIDPEVNTSGNLNKKSDVYSFGIILLELMTGRPAVIGPHGNRNHISDWVAPKLESGDIKSIMDPRLEGEFHSASAWKLLEIAISCIPPVAIQRPDIGLVVADLKECLALEISLQSAERNSAISSSPLSVTYPRESNSAPCAR